MTPGPMLHTALRKCCDSRESAYLWNVIHLLDETWTAFCEACAAAEVKTGDELHAVAGAEESWWPRGDTTEPFYARQIFRVALEDFDEWEGMAAYLGAS